jgi:hypothetical protein
VRSYYPPRVHAPHDIEPLPDAAPVVLALLVGVAIGVVLCRGIRVVHRFELDPRDAELIDYSATRITGAANHIAHAGFALAERPSFLRLFSRGARQP